MTPLESLLPHLRLAYGIQKELSQIGFDWADPYSAYEKFLEEWEEFRNAPTSREKQVEFGDVLFSWVNVFRLSSGSMEFLDFADTALQASEEMISSEISVSQVLQLLENESQRRHQLLQLLIQLLQEAKRKGIHSENALQEANRKFFQRFLLMWATLKLQGKDPYVQPVSLKEMDDVWNLFR